MTMTTTDDFNDDFAYTSERLRETTIQWATGLPTTDRRTVTGWLIPTDQDEALDETLRALGVPRVNVKHTKQTVCHWHLERAELLLVARNSEPGGDGVVLKWLTLEDGRHQSKLKARLYVRALVDAGYSEMLLLTLKSTLTSDMRLAFSRLYDMTKAAGKRDMPIYAFWLPTGPGEDVVRGSAQTKTIAPIVADVPATIERDWLVAQYAGKRYRSLIDQVERDLPQVIAWSKAESETEDDGTEAQPAEPQADDETRIASAKDRIKAITGQVTFGPLKQWLGDERRQLPQTADAWDELARWCGTVAQQRAQRTERYAETAL